MHAFANRLRELGYDEGRNLVIDYVKISSPVEYPAGMEELIRRHVEIIIAQGPEVTLKSAMAATSTIPIVMVAIDYDPFKRGYVTSLAHPTGNVTGIFFQQIELSAKRLEIAKELVPGLRSAAVLWDSGSADQFQFLKDAGEKLGINIFAVEMRNPPYNYATAWESVPVEYRGMLIVPTSGIFFRDRQQIANLTVERDSGNVRVSGMGRCRRPGIIRGQLDGFVRPRRRVCGQTGKGGCAFRPADRATDKVPTCSESENCQENRPYNF